MNIFETLDQQAETIKPSNIEQWVEPLAQELSGYLYHLSGKTYQQLDAMSLASFKKEASQKISEVLHTYFLKFEHWKQNRKFEPYLRSSLINLSKHIHNNEFGINLIQELICPLCKEENYKILLQKEDKLWKCLRCEDILLSLNQRDLSIDNQSQIKLRTIYAKHSRKGYYCLDCERFLPHSMTVGDQISCPFPDCLFSSCIFDLESTYYHPLTLLREEVKLIHSDIEMNKVSSVVNTAEEDALSQEERLILLKQIDRAFSAQKKIISRARLSSVVQKLCLLHAFENMMISHHDMMLPYLVSGKRSHLPLQALIFQEYVNLLEKQLPFFAGKKEIFDILDPHLNLFYGISQFEATVEENKIPNLTQDHYISDKTQKDHGPYYIGKLLELHNVRANISLLDQIDHYSFSEIILRTKEHHGCLVKVTHYRIPPHYQMGNLVFLQQMKKDLSDRIKKLRH